MKLEKEDIQFIDNYLSKHVKHIDIRLEMVDHVATVIETEMANGDERGFYYIFKDYMVENKVKLLDNNRKFIKTVTKKVSVKLIKTLFTIPCLAVFCVFYAFKYLFDFEQMSLMQSDWLGFAPLVGFLVFMIIYYGIITLYKIGRFVSIERLSFLCAMLVQVFNMIQNMFQLKSLNTYFDGRWLLLTLGFTILTALIILSYRYIKEHKIKAQFITA